MTNQCSTIGCCFFFALVYSYRNFWIFRMFGIFGDRVAMRAILESLLVEGFGLYRHVRVLYEQYCPLLSSKTSSKFRNLGFTSTLTVKFLSLNCKALSRQPIGKIYDVLVPLLLPIPCSYS
jgi:hypothetical protein